MRGSSRASLAEAKERLAEVLGADGASRGRISPDRLGDELFAVAGLLDSEPGLRRTLSDPAREGRAKAGLAETLLTGKISATALSLVTTLVGARWSGPADLVDATEQLAALSVIEGSDRAGGLDDLEDELFRFGRVVNAEPDLRVALSSPFASDERKQELVDTLLRGKVTQPALRLITEAALHPRGRSLDASLEEYARMAAERRERLLAEVHVAIALTAEQRGRLAAALADTYGRDVHLNIVVDPQVIGGMSVRISDELIDGSMASRLAGLRRRLAA
jgi:F-type H+-transporting ATPase subunit delta